LIRGATFIIIRCLYFKRFLFENKIIMNTFGVHLILTAIMLDVKKIFILYFMTLYGLSHAQTSAFEVHAVTTDPSIKQIIKSFEGDGVTISNISVSGAFTEGSTGSFNDTYGLLGIDKGLVMSTGKVTDAIGPNDDSGISSGLSSGLVDADLADLIAQQGGGSINDLTVIEFDLLTAFDDLSFNYVFGSEEYPEYINGSYNDVFGFFISGPGINGTKNIAVLPNSNTPVTVNSINHKNNSQYYINNGVGDTDWRDFYIQYDGYTHKLTAKTSTIPCEIYHIKLVIADVGDDVVDSGVFIEEGSFKSTNKPKIEAFYEHPKFNAALEGCSNGGFKIIRTLFDGGSINNPLTYRYNIKGSASNGIDYLTITDSVVFNPGELDKEIIISPLLDNVIEGEEIVRIELISACSNVILASAELIIKDSFDYKIPNEQTCTGKPIILNPNPGINDSLIWNNSPLLSCSVCNSPSTSLIATTTFIATVIDKESHCQTTSTALVEIKDATAFFVYSGNDNYSTLDAFFDNQSSTGSNYQWSFGDGNQSTDFEPQHTYELKHTQNSQEFTITLQIKNNIGCEDSYDTTITIGEPLFIPNVITPNGDNKNNTFIINGIKRGVWSLIVQNRWGARVYEDPNYSNDWSPQLNDGTYYFELKNPIGDRVYKGWLIIVR